MDKLLFLTKAVFSRFPLRTTFPKTKVRLRFGFSCPPRIQRLAVDHGRFLQKRDRTMQVVPI